ncbi:unnamed protein product [Cercopithifilaria johnstoni]|uniref:Uncharacterized protein n=1 Tax=Cercopithifilaria johnstoni TaxID=2874296 RepID=A0A8J2Q2Q9_9BILA|nr:unnamed protein product [Cercopithifilaria johnstoni]
MYKLNLYTYAVPIWAILPRLEKLVYNTGSSSQYDPPTRSIMEITQIFKLADFRRRNRKTASELDLHKLFCYSNLKVKNSDGLLVVQKSTNELKIVILVEAELQKCGIMNNEEPQSVPWPHFLLNHIFKVVFMGDSAVGKTCFLHRFCHNRFKLLFIATIGVDFTVKTIRLCDHIVAVQLWDTAGQEKFRNITKHYFRKENGIILMYDVTSFLNVRNWITSIKAAVDESCVMCSIGNTEFGMLFFQTSAFNGFGVNDCVKAIAL